MFEKLKAALGSLVSAASERTLSDTEISKILWDFEISLLESDVAQEVVNGIVKRLKEEFVGEKVKRGSDVKEALKARIEEVLREVVAAPHKVDVFGLISAKKEQKEPFVIVFLGINGTGKTTTVAKFAHLLKSRGLSVVIAS